MADVLFFLLLEDGGYLLQEDGVSRIILEAASSWAAKVCGSDLPLAFSVPVSAGPRIADVPLLLLPRPAQDLPAQTSPSPAAPPPRGGVKVCDTAFPIDDDTSLATWLRARGRT
jgi:hypothetical protein